MDGYFCGDTLALVKKLFLAALVFVAPHFSWGQLVFFQATLSGTNEVPPNGSAGSGFATASLNTTTNLFVFNETWTGLSASVTASHIHGPAAPGTNAPIVIPFFVGPDSASFTGTLTTSQVDSLFAGLFYVNVHTAAFPGGEIRGQLLPASAVPEPSTYAMGGVALLAAAVAIRRIRRAPQSKVA